MSDEKKQSDEKKYAQISHDFVRHCGDAVGYSNVSTDIIALLAEDANYRLREAVQSAGQFMRHAKRKKLTNGDFNNALRWSDVEPLYGYSCPDPLPFLHVKEAEVFCPEDHEINLVLMATGNHVCEHPGVPSLKAQWLAIEGAPKNEPASQNGKMNAAVTPNVSAHLMIYYNHVTKAILGNNEQVTKVALNDLKTNSKIAPLLPFFINFVCVGVKKVSHDLTQLTKLLQTVWALTNNPYLYLGPRPMLKLLVQGVLYCIVEPLAASLNPINDHWALRDFAARLLANIVRVWHTPVNRLYQNTLDALQDIFKDLTKPFCSHYGAIMAMMALGLEPVRTRLYPNISRYWTHLMTTLEDSSLSNVPFKSDANKVYGALVLASEFLMLHECNKIKEGQSEIPVESANTSSSEVQLKAFCGSASEDSVPLPAGSAPGPSISIKSEPMTTAAADKTNGAPFFVTTMYKELSEYFGDALGARLPYVQVRNLYTPKPPTLINLFATSELSQSGEEMLETFNVKEEEALSNSMEDDLYSYDDHDDNSPMSDEQEPVDVDLRIKSTVSDPTLGIKLTIAKLPRSLPPPAETVKVKKLSIKICKDQLMQPDSPPATVVATSAAEDDVPAPPKEEKDDEQPPSPEGPFNSVLVHRPSDFIDFNFDGSMPIQKEQLKRKRLEAFPVCGQSGTALELVFAISLKLEKVGKRRHRCTSLKRKASRTFQTGNVLALI